MFRISLCSNFHIPLLLLRCCYSLSCRFVSSSSYSEQTEHSQQEYLLSRSNPFQQFPNVKPFLSKYHPNKNTRRLSSPSPPPATHSSAPNQHRATTFDVFQSISAPAVVSSPDLKHFPRMFPQRPRNDDGRFLLTCFSPKYSCWSTSQPRRSCYTPSAEVGSTTTSQTNDDSIVSIWRNSFKKYYEKAEESVAAGIGVL